MAKKCYMGINGIAQRVKKGYIGVTVTEPVYETSDPITTAITSANIGNFFTVNNGSYYFKGSGAVFTTNNAGVSNSTAQTTLTAKKDMQLSFQYSYSTEANYDTFSLTVAGTTVENGVSGATTSKSWSGNLTQGQTIIFTYRKDGSQDRNDDACSFSNMQVTAVEVTQVGTVEKMQARAIKKGYIGIGGVARPFWGEPKPVYYGAITPLKEGRSSLAATTAGNYALFGGGEVGITKNTVDAYNISLTRSNPSSLIEPRSELAATTVGNYGLFAGGFVQETLSVTGSYSKTVDAYNRSLTRTTPADLWAAKSGLAATTVGNYALFAGGRDRRNYLTSVDAYSSSLTTSSPDALIRSRAYLTGASVGNYALFAGGIVNGTYNTVDAYDGSLTKKYADYPLTAAVSGAAGVSMGDYALFAGGYDGSDYVAIVDVYNSSLTKSRISDLSKGRSGAEAATVNGYTFIGGGYSGSNLAVVDTYDASLTRSTVTDLSVARSSLAAASIGNYVLFAGGELGNDEQDVVDTYTID